MKRIQPIKEYLSPASAIAANDIDMPGTYSAEAYQAWLDGDSEPLAAEIWRALIDQGIAVYGGRSAIRDELDKAKRPEAS